MGRTRCTNFWISLSKNIGIFWKNTFQCCVSLNLKTAKNVKVPGTDAHRTIFQDNSAFFI